MTDRRITPLELTEEEKRFLTEMSYYAPDGGQRYGYQFSIPEFNPWSIFLHPIMIVIIMINLLGVFSIYKLMEMNLHG